jgi:hypothetical protein
MKRGSAKQIAEERQRRAATRRKIFLKPNGWILIKTILVMVITSTGRARQGEAAMLKAAHSEAGCSIELFTKARLAEIESLREAS